mmetsp:Transcript_91877/g.187036  ORF Transcript_91877/g.187036 Transcript_91877/m.187036 type:complete len:250 (-) Transcript_91877:83-832(-)
MAAVDRVVPYHSYNQKITQDADLGPVPSPEEEAELDQSDPKLASAWTIWEQIVPPKDSKAGYSDATRETMTFATVKSFWSCWNHLPQPSELLDGKKLMRQEGGTRTIIDSLMVFRKGVRPEWEDESNVHGGHFQIQVKPELGGGVVDEIWNNIVFGMIRNSFENADMVTGVRLVDKLGQKGGKPGIRLEVWFNDMSDDDKLYRLKGAFEECIGTRLDGRREAAKWGYTETKPHSQSAAAHTETKPHSKK